VSLMGACALPLGHAATPCSAHSPAASCSCSGLSFHSTVFSGCVGGACDNRDLAHVWRPLTSSFGTVEPKYGGTMAKDTRRTLADLFGLPASGFTTLADGTIMELHVIPDFVALSRPP